MDIFAHALWTNVGGRGLNTILEKKKKPAIRVGWTVFWGVFPDLFAFTIPFISLVIKLVFYGQSLIDIRAGNSFAIAGTLYQYSHSLIIWAVVFVIVWLLYKRPRLELLGWLIHISIDIPSHAIGFYPTPFLFPLSAYRFPYGIPWSNLWFMLINYLALAVVYLGFLFHRRKDDI